MKKWIVIWIVIKYTVIPCKPTVNQYGIESSFRTDCYVSYQDTLIKTFDREAQADTFIWGMTKYPEIVEYTKSSLHKINTMDIIDALYHNSDTVYSTGKKELNTPRDTINVKNY